MSSRKWLLINPTKEGDDEEDANRIVFDVAVRLYYG